MRLFLTLGLLLLAGCTHPPQTPDINGLWINQALIDEAAQGRPLNTSGVNLEWSINTRTGKAQMSNAFELGEGQLRQTSPTAWTVDYNGYGTDTLRVDGERLVQLATDHNPQQVFSRPANAARTGERQSDTFRHALYAAYMAGPWKIIEGPGTGDTVIFAADGGVSGFPRYDQYELCLGGDCSSQGAGNDTLSLYKGNKADGWIFVRRGQRLELFHQINLSRPDEIPELTPGPRQWVLEKQ